MKTHTIDEMIDGVLKVMADKEQHKTETLVESLYEVIDHNIQENVREKMLRKYLIEPYTKDGDTISDHGMDILETGGWLVFNNLTKSNEQLQVEQLVLDVQNLKAQKPRFIATTIIAAIAACVVFYDFHLDNKIAELTQSLSQQEQRINTLSSSQNSQGDLLISKDLQIKDLTLSNDNLKEHVDSLAQILTANKSRK
jgi:hypothetical protein